MTFERYLIPGACNEPQPGNWRSACRRQAEHDGEHHTWDAATGADHARHPRVGFVLAWSAGGSVREVRSLAASAYVDTEIHDARQRQADHQRQEERRWR